MNFSIDTFMTEGLGLAKTELLVYALVHNFSQEGKGHYFGSVAYTAKALNCAECTVSEAFKSLIKKGLIKSVGIHPEYMTKQYIAIVPKWVKKGKTVEGSENPTPTPMKNLPDGGGKSYPIIKDDNKYNNKKEQPHKETDLRAKYA